MNIVRAAKNFIKHTYDAPVYGFIFDAVLPSGTTVSTVDSTVVAVDDGVSTLTLTLAGTAANGSAFTDDDGNTVAIGRAVQATVSGGTAECMYSITVKITASNGEKYGGVWVVEVPE
jgi:hypothetical protein